MKSRRAKATDIPQRVKEKVWERDGHRCIFCGECYAWPNAHYIRRSRGGLGVEQNVVTACRICHHKMDNGTGREQELFAKAAKQYLSARYRDWNEEDLIYKKG